MRIPQNYCVKVLVTGFIVLILLSLPLFWARWFCKGFLGAIMPMSYRSVDISLSSLVPSEIESDPNVIRHSQAHAHIIHPEAPQTLGIANYFSDKAPERPHSRIYYLNPDGEDSSWIYFDKRTRQINCRWPDVEKCRMELWYERQFNCTSARKEYLKSPTISSASSHLPL
jgi:hypothetical protein